MHLAEQVGVAHVAGVLLDHVYDDVADLGRVAVDVDDGVEVGALEHLARVGHLVPEPPGLGDQRLVDRCLVEVEAPSSSWNRRGTSIRASITRRNQLCSTRAMCRTIPSGDIVDGGTDRVAICSAESSSPPAPAWSGSARDSRPQALLLTPGRARLAPGILVVGQPHVAHGVPANPVLHRPANSSRELLATTKSALTLCVLPRDGGIPWVVVLSDLFSWLPWPSRC